MKTWILIIFLSLFLLPSVSANVVIGPNTTCALTHFNVTFNQNFTMDTFHCVAADNVMIFENASMLQGNFSISVVSNTTPVLVSLGAVNDSMYVNFIASNTSNGTGANFTIGLYQSGDSVDFYYDDVEATGSPLTANATGFVNYTWFFLDPGNFELVINVPYVGVVATPAEFLSATIITVIALAIGTLFIVLFVGLASRFFDGELNMVVVAVVMSALIIVLLGFMSVSDLLVEFITSLR